VDSPFVQRALEAVAKASNAILEQDALIRELNQRESGIKSRPENGDTGR
jgi:hypothetical protein